jgi:hypothetical protein
VCHEQLAVVLLQPQHMSWVVTSCRAFASLAGMHLLSLCEHLQLTWCCWEHLSVPRFMGTKGAWGGGLLCIACPILDIKAVPVCWHRVRRGLHAGLLLVVLTHSLLGYGVTLSLLGVWVSLSLCVPSSLSVGSALTTHVSWHSWSSWCNKHCTVCSQLLHDTQGPGLS